MGKALEVITGAATAPSAILTALTMASGDSLTVRKAVADSPVNLVALWTKNQTTGIVQLRSPLFHDNVRGIQARAVSADPENILPFGFRQKVRPLDQLVASISGSAAAGDLEIACMMLAYDDLDGIAARFTTPQAVRQAALNLVTVDVSIAAATGPNWTGAEALNADSDLLKGETDYALLGFDFSVLCAAASVRGSDTGNLRLACPGNTTDKYTTNNWFVLLSDALQQPWIPIINSSNKGNTFIEVVQDENAAAVTVSLLLAELPKA